MILGLLLAVTLHEQSFELARPSEVAAVLTVSCANCSWASAGREAPVLRLVVDGRYSQHLLPSRGAETAQYRRGLGRLSPGTHRLSVLRDKRTPAGVGAVTVTAVVSEETDPAVAYAPWLYARRKTIERFSDAPLLMWYETEATPRGRWIRYSVIFSNEDGGTPADRLMATWGRLTDIEYVYGVLLDTEGRILSEEYQGREHEILPFRGRRADHHPLLWVVTENNMVSDKGPTKERSALVPVTFDLTDVSREVVMDANPWTYRVSAEEAFRERRIDASARPGTRKLPDPLSFLYLEACGELKHALLAFEIGYDGGRWAASDGGLPLFRIARSGCFRGAVAVPPGAKLETLRFRACPRPPGRGEAPPTEAAAARLVRVNRLFRLGADHVPGPDLLRWTGDAVVPLDGSPVDLPLDVPRGPSESR